jgi:hypothetical protein
MITYNSQNHRRVTQAILLQNIALRRYINYQSSVNKQTITSVDAYIMITYNSQNHRRVTQAILLQNIALRRYINYLSIVNLAYIT